MLLRVAGGLSVALGLGFGLPAVYGTWYFARHGEVWTFLGFPTYGKGPFQQRGIDTSVALLVTFVSPPPLTVAVLVTFAGALLATSTASVMTGWLAAAASVSLRVQVSVPSVQPQPLPEIAVADRPVGSVSTTVTVDPSVGIPPSLPTVSV